MDSFPTSPPEYTTLMDEILAGQKTSTVISLAAKQLNEQEFLSYGRYCNQRLAFAIGFVTRTKRALIPVSLRELVLIRYPTME